MTASTANWETMSSSEAMAAGNEAAWHHAQAREAVENAEAWMQGERSAEWEAEQDDRRATQEAWANVCRSQAKK